MLPKSYIVLKWTVYALATFLFFVLQYLVLGQIRVLGLTPFLYPILPAVVASYEGPRRGAVFALILGLICDQLVVGPFEGFYTLIFTFIALLSALVGENLLSPGFLCALTVSALAMLLTNGGRILVELLTGNTHLMLMGRIALGETLITLPALLVVLPFGVGAAIYLTEYARNRKLVAVIEYAAETLSGIPSIIFGLVGMLVFANTFGKCLLAGALTLVIMNLPTVMRTAQESLKTVPTSLREGAFGLGAGKWRVVRTVVLPGCVDGIITGCILSAGRIMGESAALLFTAGFAHALNGFFSGLGSPGATLTVALYLYANEPRPGAKEASFAIAAILMLLTLAINFAAVLVGRYFKKRSAL